MSVKTLAELRTSVRVQYGDSDGVTATDAEVDLLLEDGINRVLDRCPWLVPTLVSGQSITTDVISGAALTLSADIAQINRVEVKSSTVSTYKRLTPIQFGVFNGQLPYAATTAEELEGYYFDNNRIMFYPPLPSATFDVRFYYGAGTIGSSFPSSAGSSLPASIPVQAEEAGIAWAISRLCARDNDIETAQFWSMEFESRIQRLVDAHNRPQLGEVLQVLNTDNYYLDADPSAW